MLDAIVNTPIISGMRNTPNKFSQSHRVLSENPILVLFFGSDAGGCCGVTDDCPLCWVLFFGSDAGGCCGVTDDCSLCWFRGCCAIGPVGGGVLLAMKHLPCTACGLSIQLIQVTQTRVGVERS